MIDQLEKLRVAGMVTLYNSEQEVVQRISTYINQVATLYAVDNSEQVDKELINSIISTYPTVRHINNQGNKGIAHALNVAAQAAISDQCDYLLMMDDDSEAPADLVSRLSGVFGRAQAGSIGIVAAQSDNSVHRDDEQEVVTAITSGSLLSLRAYEAVGPFLDALFIDWVDHEYCFRLAAYKYRIVVVNQVRLTHRLGIFKKKRLLGLVPVRWRSHSPVRLYYKFRNSIYVMNMFGGQLRASFVASVYYELARDVVRVIFVEDHKKDYFTYIIRGLSDAYKKKLGKLSA